MNSNDSLNNKKQANIRLRHMFQASDEDNSGVFIPDTLDNEKLNKISLRFESKQQQDTSVLESVKQMIELNETDPTKSLLDYIEGLKALYKKESVNETIDPSNEAELVEEVNIDHLISEGEEYIKSQDQKALLHDLINDINSSSNNKSQYNDDDFEKNILKIMQSPDEDNEDEINTNETNNNEEAIQTNHEPIVNEDIEVAKGGKGKLYAFLLFVIIGIVMIIYLYNEQLFALYDQVSEYISSFVSNLNI